MVLQLKVYVFKDVLVGTRPAQEIYRDPVVSPDGFSYERAAVGGVAQTAQHILCDGAAFALQNTSAQQSAQKPAARSRPDRMMWQCSRQLRVRSHRLLAASLQGHLAHIAAALPAALAPKHYWSTK